MQKLIESFIASLKSDGKSKHTIEAYRLDLKEFSEFFKDFEVSQIKYIDLQSWKNNLERNGLSASSMSRKISSVKSFFHYLTKIEVIDKNPTSLLDRPRIEKKQPVVISSEEATDVLFHARNDSTSETFFFRDYTIMAMFLYTGIRREELTNISLNDVNLKYGTILIHGKGAKQRTVYINDELHPILSEYILHYRSMMPKSIFSNYLFPSKKTGKISIRSVNNIVNKFFESAGIKQKGVSAHILRKRFATSVFESTGDIARTSKLLGHSSPTVTMRYVSIGENSMRDATNCVSF